MKCPFCAEEINPDAVICRFCHKKLKVSDIWRRVKLAVLITLIVFFVKNWHSLSEFAGRAADVIGSAGVYLKDIKEGMDHGFESIGKNKRDNAIKQYLEMQDK